MNEKIIEQCVVKLECGEEIGNALIINNSQAITVSHCVREYFDNGECIKLYYNGEGKTEINAIPQDYIQSEADTIVVLSFSPLSDVTVFPLLISYKPNVHEKAATYGFNKNYSDRAVWRELKCISNNVGSQSEIIQDLVFMEESSEKSVEGLSGSPIVQLEDKRNVYGLVSTERLENGSLIDIEGISLLSNLVYLKGASVQVNSPTELIPKSEIVAGHNYRWGDFLIDDTQLNPYLFYAETIEFCGRQNEMRDLKLFIENDQRFSWWILSGEAGSGKSRIAYELYKELSSSGWDVSYLYNENSLSSGELQKSIENNPKSLIIADNGRTYAYTLGKWMLEIINNASNTVRVLLIDRNTKDDQDDILLHSLYENDLNGQLSNHIWNKKHLKLGRFEDDEVKEVISSYARHRKLMMSEEVMENLINILHVIDEDYMRPLYALFIVDAWSEGFDLANCKLESIIEWIIERENRHRANTIRESVGDSRVNMRRVKSINTLLFISTYNGGIDLDTFKEKYRVYWSDAERLIEDSATGVELEDVLVSAGLLVDNIVLSLKPDILGEYYIISNFGKMKPAMFTDGWSDNENLQAFLLRTLYDYRDKIINYKPFRIPFLKEFLQGKPSSQKAIDIYCNTLNRLIIDDRLESVSDYVKKLAEIYDYNGGIQSAIYYSRGLLDLSARQTDLSGIVETVEILRSLEEKFNNSDIRLYYVKALFNLSNSQKLTDKYRTIKSIKRLLEKEKDNQLIAYEYARSLYNLYGFQPPDAEMKTAEELKRLSEEYDDNEDIAKEYAMFLFNIHDEGLNNKQIESIVDQLYTLSLRFIDNSDIQFYIIWGLRFISNNQTESDRKCTDEIILKIKSLLKKEDNEMIEVRGALKFYRDEDGEQMFKVIRMGGKLYFDEDSFEESIVLQ